MPLTMRPTGGHSPVSTRASPLAASTRTRREHVYRATLVLGDHGLCLAGCWDRHERKGADA
jgi:hypothetical protein